MAEAGKRRQAELKLIEAAYRWRRSMLSTGPATFELADAIDALRGIPLDAPDGAPVSAKAPKTAKDAAVEFQPLAGALAMSVFDMIASANLAGARGYTSDQLEQLMNRQHQSISARLNELRNKGWIMDSGVRRPTRAGRSAIVWEPTEKGLEQREGMKR